ncbi:MAG: PD-(D/E)XK nuclease-like domain-containing protein [Phycisphaerales bacterium]|nr:PD-(D/E)XK nuclease-like domain-containing protein [Phycisphaerales bacterium]
MDTELNIDLSILGVESAEEYHAQAGRNLSSHQLLDFMKCPWLHRKKAIGLMGDSDSVSYFVGRAAHVRILEGRENYTAMYALGWPINSKTGKPFGANTQAFREWAEGQGKPVLSQDQVDLIEQMAAGVAMNDEATDLLLYGRSEGVVRAEYCGTPCQIRIDWLHPQRGIVDFKTCDDLTWFEADAKRYGYAKQMAFYQAVLAQALGGLMVPVHLIAIEKKEPFRCGVWRVTEDTLQIARQENEAAIRRFLKCRETDEWKTGYEEIRMLNVA